MIPLWAELDPVQRKAKEPFEGCLKNDDGWVGLTRIAQEGLRQRVRRQISPHLRVWFRLFWFDVVWSELICI